MRANKWVYLHVVQGLYPGPHGWEDLTQSEVEREARTNLREYRANEPGTAHRMIKRRERNPVRIEDPS